MPLSYTYSLAAPYVCSLLMRLPFLSFNTFMTIVYAKSRHNARMDKLVKAELLEIDREIFTSLYGKYTK